MIETVKEIAEKDIDKLYKYLHSRLWDTRYEFKPGTGLMFKTITYKKGLRQCNYKKIANFVPIGTAVNIVNRKNFTTLFGVMDNGEILSEFTIRAGKFSKPGWWIEYWGLIPHVEVGCNRKILTCIELIGVTESLEM